jgi:protein-disulfide isomerase
MMFNAGIPEETAGEKCKDESRGRFAASWNRDFRMPETQELDPSRLLLPIHADDHVRGPADAAYTLVEYGDYECPACGRLFAVIRDLQPELSSMLRIAYRHYPLSGIHPHAQLAAEAAEAAGAQGRFWDMHDLLFQNQNALAPKYLYQYAEQIGLDAKRFRDELKARRYEDLVREHFRRGVQNGVYGTPGLFVNDVRYTGALDLDTLRRIVNSNRGRKFPA